MKHPPHSGIDLHGGFDLSGMTQTQLWLSYVSVGGAVAALELEAYVLGLLVPSRLEHNMIAQAINEHFLARGQDHPVAYDDSPARNQDRT